jgi:hypothetical protein
MTSTFRLFDVQTEQTETVSVTDAKANTFLFVSHTNISFLKKMQVQLKNYHNDAARFNYVFVDKVPPQSNAIPPMKNVFVYWSGNRELKSVIC